MMYAVRQISVTLDANHALFYDNSRLVMIDNFIIISSLKAVLEYEYTLYSQAPHKNLTNGYRWQSLNSDDLPEHLLPETPNTEGYAIMLDDRVVYWTTNAVAAKTVLNFCNQERNYWRKDE